MTIDEQQSVPLSKIDLQLGWPTPRLFAAPEILEGATNILTSPTETAAALVYGPHQGHPPLRVSLSEWLVSVYGLDVCSSNPDRLCITNGASGNLSNVLQRFTDPTYTRRIFMTEPTYFLACPIFEDNGFRGKLCGVRETVDGLDLEYLRYNLEQSEKSRMKDLSNCGEHDVPKLKTGSAYPKVYKYIIYTVATFSNPSGKTLSIETRRELVRLAREFDALVISDDVYDFLSWSDNLDFSDTSQDQMAPPPRLVDVDYAMEGYSKWGNTISNGSFSKIIGPGVRVGWAECTPAFAHQLAETGSSSSGGAPSHLTSTFVDQMLRSSKMQDHISKVLIPTYRKRYRTLVREIQHLLGPLGVLEETKSTTNNASNPCGGFFTYLRLPSDLPSAKQVAAFALHHYSLRVAFGHMFVVAGDEESSKRVEAPGSLGHSIRLCWAWHEVDQIKEGIRRLADAIIDIRRRMKLGETSWNGLAIGIR